MSKNLTEERNKVSFNLHDLALYIYDNEEYYKNIMEGYKILSEDPILRNDMSILGKSRIDTFKIFCKKGLRLHERFNSLVNDLGPYSNHFSNQIPGSTSVYMFYPYIKHLGTDKQVAQWTPLILRGIILGSYVQTELGHGSDIRSLETTATFDPKTDEFIINSPTLTSTKFWPGDLGFTANHIVVMAQLIINGEKKGVHGFIVQIRDIETHKVLPNIEVGDIGEKVGFNTKDNGYCRFDNVRIPRTNMLMKYTKVSKNGEYKKKGDERIGYAIMMQVRDMLGHFSWRALSHACVIATRYSIVRTQFRNEEGVERKIFDYQIQQDKILPLIAQSLAIHAGAKKSSEMAQQNIKNIQEKEDFSLMKEVHATLCCTKAFYSFDTDFGIQRARQACGGHGYNSYSGFSTLWKEYSPTITYEGENTIMALQTARFLVSCLDKMRNDEPLPASAAYLKGLEDVLSGKRCQVQNIDDFNIDTVLLILQANASFLVYKAATNLMKGAQDSSIRESWDKKAGLSLVEAARAHTSAFTYQTFYDKINRDAKSPALKVVLQRLCLLYGIDKLLAHPLGLFESEYVSPKQISLLGERKEALLTEIRPDAIGVVDAFGYPDNTLASALGVYDGNVYETLMKYVRENNEFNKHDFTETFQTYIKGLRNIEWPLPKL